MAKLTIVVPVYQVLPYLEQCITSLLCQTFADFTLLLLDDGSTDGSGAMCDGYAKQDARITVVHQQNIGVEQTILKGIRMADTPYIGFLDGDDWVQPTFYQTLIDALEEYCADMVQCGTCINGTTPAPALCSDTLYCLTDLRNTVYQPFFEKTGSLTPLTNARWSKVYRTDLLQKAIADVPQGVQIGEDLLMNLAYLKLSRTAVVLANQDLHCYRCHANSLTQKYSDKKQTSILRLYELLCALAKKEGFSNDAVRKEGKNETCALMLDVLLSPLSVSEKTMRLRVLYAHLTDDSHLLAYAKERPLVGKLALYLVHLRLFWLVSASVSGALWLSSIRDKNTNKFQK